MNAAEEPLIPLEEPEPDITEEDAAEPADEPELEPDAEPEPHVESSQTTLAKRDKALTTETKRHETALRKAYGDDFETLAPCPLCLTDGWVIPAPPGAFPPEQWDAVKIAAGQDAGENFKLAYYAEPCPTCDGWGKVATGSHVTDLGTPICRDCNGQGWREKQAPLAPVASWQPPVAPPIVNRLPGEDTGEYDKWGRPAGHERFGIDIQYTQGTW
jgi:hypothetical protein